MGNCTDVIARRPPEGPAGPVPTATPRTGASRVVVVVSGLTGLGWYVAFVGAFTLDPRAFGWLGTGDRAQHVLGWQLFRNAPWMFPLGTLPNLAHPLGTTIGFTDSNPWLALLAKPFDVWLPRNTQLIGPWLASCFTLQGIVGAELMARFTPRPLQQILGAALFVTTPVLLARIDHDTLCAHWLLLVLIVLYVQPHSAPRRTLAWAACSTLLAAGIHPYLAVMVLALALGLVVQLSAIERRLSSGAAAVAAGGLVLGTVGVFVCLGFIGWQHTSPPGGFGYYSADLSTLLNSAGRSRWLPALPTGRGQYEGFAFLGSGVMGLAGVAALRARGRVAWRRAARPYAALVVVALGCAVFALSSRVTLAGSPVASLRTLYAPLHPVTSAFRSSGRFVWPLHYVVLSAVLALVTQPEVLRSRTATVLLALAVVVQMVEVPSPWPRTVHAHRTWPRLEAVGWEDMTPPRFRHLVRYPPHFVGYAAMCNGPRYPFDEFIRFTDLAFRLHLTVNGGYLARIDQTRARAYCAELSDDIRAGQFKGDTVYVVAPGWEESFTRPDSGVACSTIEGYLVCTVPTAPARR